MPKRGGKGKKKGRRGGYGSNRELLVKEEEGEEYAQVLKISGGGRYEVHCMDDVKRVAKMRGKFRKRIRVSVNDVLLVILREFQENKCDIIHVYYADEVKQLKQLGEIPQRLEINENSTLQNQQLNIEFEEKDEEPKAKAQKQRLEDFMPDSSSEDEEDEVVEAKPVAKPKPVAKAEEKKAPEVKKVEEDSDSEEEDEEEDEDSEESEKEFDPLADI